jgi:hypothetical protein
MMAKPLFLIFFAEDRTTTVQINREPSFSKGATNDFPKHTAAEIAAQAARMLDDDRARDAVTHFHAQWLGLGGLKYMAKDHHALWRPAGHQWPLVRTHRLS